MQLMCTVAIITRMVRIKLILYNLSLQSFIDSKKFGKFSKPYVFKSHASGQTSKDAEMTETVVKPSENAASHVVSNGNGRPANGKVFAKQATCYIRKSDQHLIANCPKKSTLQTCELTHA